MINISFYSEKAVVTGTIFEHNGLYDTEKISSAIDKYTSRLENELKDVTGFKIRDDGGGNIHNRLASHNSKLITVTLDHNVEIRAKLFIRGFVYDSRTHNSLPVSQEDNDTMISAEVYIDSPIELGDSTQYYMEAQKFAEKLVSGATTELSEILGSPEAKYTINVLGLDISESDDLNKFFEIPVNEIGKPIPFDKTDGYKAILKKLKSKGEPKLVLEDFESIHGKQDNIMYNWNHVTRNDSGKYSISKDTINTANGFNEFVMTNLLNTSINNNMREVIDDQLEYILEKLYGINQ